MDGTIQWILDKFFGAFVARRRLRVVAHQALFKATGTEAVFINVTNLSQQREVEITHVYFDLARDVHAIQSSRPLPKRLKPDETWETWVALSELPSNLGPELFRSVRVRLSTGRVVKGSENKGVPTEGTIPGGPVHRQDA